MPVDEEADEGSVDRPHDLTSTVEELLMRAIGNPDGSQDSPQDSPEHSAPLPEDSSASESQSGIDLREMLQAVSLIY
jgi:hypothetical protein